MTFFGILKIGPLEPCGNEFQSTGSHRLTVRQLILLFCLYSGANKYCYILVQPVSRKMPFCRCTLQGLLSHKYWWPMTHFLPRHGRFCVPKRNSEDKSIMCPTGPPQVRTQNKGYWQYSNIWLKINSSIQIAWLPDVFKSTFVTVFETLETQEFNKNKL